MAKPWARAFYQSKEWRECRATYISNVAGLCERCQERGIIRAGLELHHIEELTPENINDPSITLNHDNLVYLCHDCHMIVHGEKNLRRYVIDSTGKVEGIDAPHF